MARLTLPLALGAPPAGTRRAALARIAQACAFAASPAAMAAPTAGGAHELRRRVKSTVVARGDSAWPAWCEAMVWQQRKPARRPPIIVRAHNEMDVIECVRFARRNGLKVGVRSGGHSVWATFMRDEGLLIDLSLLVHSSIQRDSRSAVVQPALWGYHLIERAAPHGLAFPVAHCAQVGLGGFVIGGGLGLNHDHWGRMACFGIEGADVVTAQGERITVDAGRHTDLLWAVRGAGQGFPGIVTKLHLALQTRPSVVLKNLYVLPLARAAEAADWVVQAMGEQPPSVEVLMVLVHGPAGPAAVVMANAFAANMDEARASLAPFAASELPKVALFKVEGAPSTMEQLLVDSINPMTGFGFGGYAVDMVWATTPGPAVAAAAQHIARAPSKMSHAVIAFKSGRPLPADAACSRIDRCFVGLYGAWVGREHDTTNVAWLREASTALQPMASGHYINEIDAEATPAKAQACFSPAAWQRLAEVRKRHDPQGLFHSFLGLS